MVDTSSTWPIGLIIQTVGYGINIFGKHVMRRAGVEKKPGCSWLYLYSAILVTTMGIMEVFALMFMPSSVASACAGLAQVWNCVLAPFTLGEPLTRQRLAASAIILVGTVAAAVCAGSEGANHDSTRAEFISMLESDTAIVFYAIMGSSATVSLLLYLYGPASTPRALCIAIFGGGSAGLYFFETIAIDLATPCVFDTAEACSALVPNSTVPYNPGADPLFLSFSLCALFFGFFFCLVVLAFGLRTYPALLLVTLYEAFVVIFGNLSGLLVLGEYEALSGGQLAGFSVATLVIVLGLLTLLVWPTRLLGDGDAVVYAGPHASAGREAGTKRPPGEASTLLPSGKA